MNGPASIGLLLAGGTGSRLLPLTRAVNKHLLNVYDKPLLYYSLSLLLLAGLRDIVVICRKKDEAQISALLGDGSAWGISIQYVTQDHPNGIAEVFPLCAHHIRNRPSVLVLGDNIIHGSNLSWVLKHVVETQSGADILGYPVKNPQDFGVVELDAERKPIKLVEKPRAPQGNLAVPGFYSFDADVVDMARALKPSARGELEITDLNQLYLNQSRLKVHDLGRGVAWLDGGSPEGLYEASQYVRTMQERSGLIIASPEEIAWRNGWIDDAALEKLCGAAKPSSYLRALLDIMRAER